MIRILPPNHYLLFVIFILLDTYTSNAEVTVITDPPPKVSISSSAPNPTYSNPILLRASFSELVDGFHKEDITVTNGSVSSFQRAVTYSATLGPDLVNDESLMSPRAVAFDQQNNMYVADATGHHIKVFDTNNNLIHTIGSGRLGTGDYEFNSPNDLLIDHLGRLIVADAGNHRIQIFDSTLKYVATVGNGSRGVSNDEFNDPLGLAVDARGRLFVADASNHRIQVFDAEFNYIATIGQWGNTAGQFNHPSGIAIDSKDNIYVADRFNYRVQIFDSNFVYVNSIGGSEQGTAPDLFDRPGKIAINSQDQIIVSDDGNIDIRIFDSQLNSLGIIGNTRFPGDDPYSFNFPLDVAVDSNDKIYCIDDNAVIKVYDTNYQFVKAIDGGLSGKEYDAFKKATGIAIDANGNIYVADLFKHRLQVYDRNFNFLKTFDVDANGYSRIYAPWTVTVDSQGKVYVANDNHVLIYDQNHAYQARIDAPEWYSNEEKSRFSPKSITIDSQGKIYICDYQNHRVLIYDQNFTYLTSLGNGTSGNSNDQFSRPKDITIDHQGNLYIADVGNHRIQVFDNNQQYLTSFYPPGSGKYTSSYISHIAVDSLGNIYVPDWVEQVVQVFDKNHQLIATLGKTGITGTDNNTFIGPGDIAFDANNRIYVADQFRIQRYEALTDYQFEIMPSDEGEVRLDIAAGVAVNATGNPNEAAERFTISYDLRPTVTLSKVSFDRQEQVFTLGIHFSEPISDFRASDITTNNGTVSSLQTTDSVFFQAIITPTKDGEVHISVPESIAFDTSGQGNQGSLIFTFEYDSTLPIVEFTSKQGAYTNHSPIQLGLLFSEPVAVLTAEDLQLTNAVVTSFRPAQPDYVTSIGTNLIDKGEFIKFPTGIALDSREYLYVAATSANQIKIYDQSMNLVSTIGDGTLGSGEYQFSGLSDIFIDSDNKIYVVDGSNHRVQIYDQQKKYLATLGSSKADTTAGHFNNPASVAVDSEGKIYVVDRANQRVQIFDANREHLHTLGTTGVSGSQNDQFNNPANIDISVNGFIYVVDNFNHRVQVFDSQFHYHGTLGSTGVMGSGNNQFIYPTDVFTDDEGNIYVADAGNNDRIQVYDKDLNYLKSIPVSSPTSIQSLILNAKKEILYSNDLQVVQIDQNANYLSAYGTDGSGSDDYTFNKPVKTDIDMQNRLYVADEKNNRVQVFDQHLNLIRSLDGIKDFTAYDKFTNPTDVAVDKDGRIFVADSYHRSVHVYDSNFAHIETITLPPRSSGSNSFGIDVDNKGRLYIADTYNDNIVIYNQNFQHETTLGTSSSGSGMNQFDYPTDVVLDNNGNIYVSDLFNWRIQIFDSTLAYKSTIDYSDMGNRPYTLEVDKSGNIYVTDFGNSVTVYDSNLSYLYQFGGMKSLPNNQFFRASGISVDSTGLIYITDQETHNIKIYRPQPRFELELTPTTDGEIVVELPANATTDLYGNGNEETRFSIVYDSKGPIASLSAQDSISSEASVQVDITFNEKVSGLQASSFTLTNATLDQLQTSDSTHFTAHLTATEEGYFRIALDSASVKDMLGNVNSQTVTLQILYDVPEDTIAPTVAITSSAQDTVESIFVVNFIFSEKVSGFDVADISLSNASLAAMETVDSTLFTATVTPIETGFMNLSIAKNVVEDAVGNANQASEVFSLYYNRTYSISIQLNTEDEAEIGGFIAVLYQERKGKFVSLSSLEDPEGNTVQFDNLQEGSYTVGIQPLDANYLTTYLGNELLLSNAQIINLNQDTQYDITLYSVGNAPKEGPAMIFGILLEDEQTSGSKIYEGTNQVTGIPLVNVNIYLLDASTGKMIAIDITDKEGRFSFSNLLQGEYLIMADYEGLPNYAQSNRIHIVPDTELIRLTVVAGAEIRIVEVQEEKEVTAIVEDVFSKLRYGPNPVIDQLHLKVGPSWLQGKVIVCDSMGKMLFSNKLDNDSSKLDFSNLPTGVYVLNVLKENQQLTFKVTK